MHTLWLNHMSLLTILRWFGGGGGRTTAVKVSTILQHSEKSPSARFWLVVQRHTFLWCDFEREIIPHFGCNHFCWCFYGVVVDDAVFYQSVCVWQVASKKCRIRHVIFCIAFEFSRQATLFCTTLTIDTFFFLLIICKSSISRSVVSIVHSGRVESRNKKKKNVSVCVCACVRVFAR